MAKYSQVNKLSVFARARIALALTAVAAASLAPLHGCAGPQANNQQPGAATRPVSSAASAQVRWRLRSSLRQSSYLRLDLPVVVAGTKITISDPVLLGAPALKEGALLDSLTAAQTQPADLPPDPDAPVDGRVINWAETGGELAVFSSRVVRGGVDGPLVDQLTAQPRTTADGGSFLVPLAPAPDPAGRTFTLTDPMPVYIKLTVPPGADPGEYRFGVTIQTPGKGTEQDALALTVSDIALPTEPRVLGVMTTTMAKLANLYPETFGTVSVNYLDRGDNAQPEQRAAVEQLDALMQAARREGMALFVEDLTPQVRVDEHGLVTVDWDAYDRVMAPFMDGSAFPDRLPQPVWLAPLPPRRIRDSSTQLWQYMNACARHFADRGWVATPVFMHPVLAEPAAAAARGEDPREEDALRSRVIELMRLHMPREMLAVSTPDISGAVAAAAREPARGTPGAAAQPGANLSIPHGQLWVVGADTDARLPPAGPMGGEASVRVWPWMCVARAGTLATPGVRGFIWRDALAAAADLKGGDDLRAPLLVVDRSADAKSPALVPSLRMVWLSAGLNDAALLGLLEKRSDPAMVNEVLAGLVGRTGLRDDLPRPGGDWPLAPAGYLYAGWPAERAMWNQVTPMLERLVLAHDPGEVVKMRQDDPLYLAAKMWLAQARRPVARIGAYEFSLRPGRGSDIVDARVSVLAENPVADRAEFDLRFTSLPGDFDMAPEPGADAGAPLRRRSVTMAPSALGRIDLPLAGHIDALVQAPGLERLELTERHGGMSLRLPVRLPVYRTRSTAQWGAGPPRPDGNAADWPADPQLKLFGEMAAGLRYASRPDLLSATVREDGAPASVRWSYDNNFLYVLARCPQELVSDDRNSEWPVTDPVGGGRGRWWGGDGLQLQLADVGSRLEPGLTRTGTGEERTVVQIAFKPAGVLLVRTGTASLRPGGAVHLAWRDGPPTSSGPALRYGISLEKRDGRTTGYLVEAAIPRTWVSGNVANVRSPAWRLNVLRHRANDLASMSWSGPLVDDEDVAMMGLLVGE